MDYIKEVIAMTEQKNSSQPEFLQTVREVLGSIGPFVDENEAELRKYSVLERLVEPDRQIIFKVPWMDDNGVYCVNRGYRVQFNNALGPYKGGLRFRNNVNLSVIKFLGFEQIFKNSLTSLPLGGAKGGSDFDPRGKSDMEIMRFCQSFMTELYRHIGADLDVPAGDIGVGSRELGFLYGQYKRITGNFISGVLTGKGLSYGGSLIRPEATGYGAAYLLCDVLDHLGDSIEGKTFCLSGYGNAAWGAAKKISALGGKVLTLSGGEGYVYDKDGVSGEKVDFMEHMLTLRAEGKSALSAYAEKYHAEFFPGEKPWGNVPADVYMPCACQNEIDVAEAEKMVDMGVKYLCEVSNMPTSNEAIALLQSKNVVILPAKAANAGGVAVSGLEMAQNSARLVWSADKVDAKLKEIMHGIHEQMLEVINLYKLPYDLVAGANIAGFKKVADAMLAQGV